MLVQPEVGADELREGHCIWSYATLAYLHIEARTLPERAEVAMSSVGSPKGGVVLQESRHLQKRLSATSASRRFLRPSCIRR